MFRLLNGNILVEEIYDDIKIDNIVTAYDGDSFSMFCRVISLDNTVEAELDIHIGDVVVIKRYAKEEFIGDYFFISSKDVRCVINENNYRELVSQGI